MINRLEVVPSSQVCDASGVCGLPEGGSIHTKVWGTGKCDDVALDYGDGTPPLHSGPVDFGSSGSLTPWEVVPDHVYKDVWPGAKSIHAFPFAQCAGEQRQTLVVLTGGPNFHTDFWLAYGASTTNTCDTVPKVNRLRTNAKVTVAANPNQNVKINFGCAFNGCIYDADGEPNSTAPANFPFPNFRKYSLILRVGQQVVQGGTNASFTTTQGGMLEVCVNDPTLGDNSGAWGLNFFVDETHSP